MKAVQLEQGSAEWKAARCGMVTASRINDVLATIKTGEAAARRDYKAQLIAEILTGQPQDDTYINAAMQWGTDTEPFARAAYEIAESVMVDQVGFVTHPRLAHAGASPDGLVGSDGLVEIKCPKTATHLQTVLSGKIPSQYENQMLWQMACTERQWCDFVSFDPRLPEGSQLFKARFHRDEERIAKIETEVLAFVQEILKAVDLIRQRSA